MANLFIGCDYIDFIYANTAYRGILSKVVLEQKTIFRMDYSSTQSGSETNRLEINYTRDPVSQQLTWIPDLCSNPELIGILRRKVEKNAALFHE